MTMLELMEWVRKKLTKLRGFVLGKKENPSSGIIKTLLPFKGLGIILVVTAHAAIGLLAAEVNMSPGPSLGPIVFGQWQLASPWKSIVLELCRCAVPMFLFASGFYMAFSPRTWKGIFNSCVKLITPMIFWSLLGWALSWRSGIGGWSIFSFLVILISGKAQLGYFFIILSIQFYVLSKWLVPVAAKYPTQTIGCAILMQIAVHFYDYLYLLGKLTLITPLGWIEISGPFPEFLFPRFIVSFCLGIIAFQYSRQLKEIVNKRLLLGLITGLSAICLIAERGLIFRHAFQNLGMTVFQATAVSWVEWKITTSIWTVSSTFFLLAMLRRWQPLGKLLDIAGKYSFQIFLLHGMVLETVKIFYYKFFSGQMFYGAIGFIFAVVAGIVIPIFATKLIQKRMPNPVRVIALGS